jgi:hypothetical protein
MGGSVMDLLDGAEDHRRGALDRPAHQVPGAVAVLYLGEPLFGRHELAVRTGGHVTERQHAGKRVGRRLELQPQDVSKSAFAGFDDGAGVMRDQPAHQSVSMPCVAQIPGAIELVQAREGKAGGVANVVHPRGGFQQIDVSAENRCQAARAATPWECAQRRGKGSCRSARASGSAREAAVFMRPRLGSHGGTFTGVACRLKTSYSASRPIIWHCWLERGGLACIRESHGFGGTAEIHTEIIGRGGGLQAWPGLLWRVCFRVAGTLLDRT